MRTRIAELTLFFTGIGQVFNQNSSPSEKSIAQIDDRRLSNDLSKSIFHHLDQPIEPRQSNYSNHHCVGGSDYSSNFAERSCILYNVCHVEGEEDVLHYYVDKDRLQRPIFSENNGFVYDFGPNLVPLSSYVRTYDLDPTAKHWSPSITFSTAPEYSYDTAHLALFYKSWAEMNPAELVNLMLAIVGIPMMHGYEFNKDIRILDEKEVVRRTKHREELIHKVFTNHQPLRLHETGNMCFKRLLVGGGYPLSVLYSHAYTSIVAPIVRNKVVTHFNIQNLKLTRHKVIFLVKNPAKQVNTLPNQPGDDIGSTNNMNHILNYQEVFSYLNKTFGAVTDVEMIIPDNYAWKELIEKLQTATIIITASGGGSFTSFYAPPSTTLLFIDRNYDGKSGRFRSGTAGTGLEDSFWSQLSYPKFHYPCCNVADCPDNIVIRLPRMQYMLLLALQSAEDYHVLMNSVELTTFNAMIAKAPKTVDICSLS